LAVGNTVKVLVRPSDERMRSLISLKAFGLSEIEAVRYYTAMMMAERGIVSAPNMAAGVGFTIGGNVTPTIPIPPPVSGVGGGSNTAPPHTDAGAFDLDPTPRRR